MESRHCLTLELPKILERLAERAAFSAGAEKARSLAPSSLPSEVRENLETTSEARALLSARPQTSLGGARDVRSQVAAAQRGATLPAVELLDVRSTLIAARTLHQTLTRLDRQFPRLADIAGRIAPNSPLIDEIGRCLDERGQVQDSASDKLARVRRELRVAHDRLLDKLQRIIASPGNAQYLQESLITQRDNRYVIPLKADFKGRIRGIVHDRSSSGATLFIEPLSVVNLNNEWRELQIEEQQEIARILGELSAQIAERGAEIVHTVDALADLDLAFAKAKYAEEIDASAPELVRFGRPEDGSTHPSRTLRLLQARHPLLDPETVVPIDVELDDATHVLVITGPNTGGKTVSLKTVGLLVLMAQAGMHIPVAPGSALSPFETVYADIGDEQSIEQSLSTFSAHLTNILSFIERADAHSLVLLDELGAGTDPAEGSALARALLDAFRTRGATILVATHYPELKAYAQVTPGVQNASVEFDTQTLRPTYRLTIGVPGRSNAFAIARRLGLNEALIAQAEALVGQEERQTEHMLSDLHHLRLQAVTARDQARAAQTQIERQERELRLHLAEIEQERAAILQRAHDEAEAEVEALREEASTLRQRLESAAALAEVEAAEAKIAALEAAIPAPPEPLSPPEPEPAPIPRRPIRAGDFVWVAALGAEGEVLSIDGDEAEVQVGPARMRTALKRLKLRSGPKAAPHTPLPSIQSAPVGTRLDLRGCLVEDAIEQLDRYLDAAALTNVPWVHIVHGKGTGALRQAVRDFVRTHSLVESYRSGDEGEGGEGVTVARLLT